jgi:acetoacetate decarboxylase
MRMLPFPCLLAMFLSTILANGAQAVDPPHSMPAADPMYPAPPWTYRDCNMLQISFRSDPDVVSRMVPAPLVPNPDGVMVVWLADMKIVEPFKLTYLEHGLAVPSQLNGKPVLYCTHLYLNDDTAIAAGREIWGWPKKHAAMTYTRDGGSVVTATTRRGVEIVRGTFQATGDAPIADVARHYVNYKLIPSANGTSAHDVRQLTSTTLLRTTRVRKNGTATLQFRSSSADALGQITVNQILNAEYSEFDFTLSSGEVVHDYLQQSGAQSPVQFPGATTTGRE